MSRLDFCKYELVDDCYDWKNDNCDECNIFKAYCEGARRAKNLIVRCKDCKHSDTTGAYVEDVVYCKWLHTSCVKNGYCHRGERKGGDDE